MSKFKRGASGNPRGRPKGSKDSVPRTFRASIKAMYQKLATERPELFEDAITRDLQNRRGISAFHHIQLAAAYIDGKPKDVVQFEGRGKLIEVILSGTPTPPDESKK